MGLDWMLIKTWLWRFYAVITRKNLIWFERDRIFTGSPGETFANDEYLPSLPVPNLDETLKKYLESVIPHTNKEELEKTREIVEAFGEGLGKELHRKLEDRAEKSRNWLEKWWEENSYLSVRQPLLPFLNICLTCPVEDKDLPVTEDGWLERAALQIHYTMKFWTVLRREELRPFKNRATNAPWSMDQFRNLFSTARIPKDPVDELVSFFQTEASGKESPRHIVILCRGHIFTFDVIDGNDEPLTAPEILSLIQKIYFQCQALDGGPGLGALTATDRSTWAKNRKYLQNTCRQNTELLKIIDTAIEIVVLDDQEPKIYETPYALLRNCENRWADKGVEVYFKNGRMTACGDHSAFDGMVPMVTGYYVMMSMMGSSVWKGTNELRELPEPKRIVFELDEAMVQEIRLAKEEYLKLFENFQVAYSLFEKYGKSVTKKYNFHPDAFVQMALQLAYFRLHQKPASTYVTASTRQFYHGRTETCRSCTKESMAWVLAMEDSQVEDQVKLQLLREAIDTLNKLNQDCMNNKGCDRHLFGLYKLSQEEGLPVPEIFLDPSYQKSGGFGNFVLSTSLGGYTKNGGFVGPMCKEGYGIFYNIEDKRMYFHVTAHRECVETDAYKMYSNIEKSLENMLDLLSACHDN